MIVLCYHNGALGRTVAALIECCTKEGSREFPSFVTGKNLHHYKPEEKLFQIKHPFCEVKKEKEFSNTVISSTSNSHIGRFLILLMGLKKWSKNEPKLNQQFLYNQTSSTYGEQLEVLSITLRDKVKSANDWYLDADCVLDILDFWDNHNAIIKWLTDCGFTPVSSKVHDFCQLVAESNRGYYDSILKCTQIVQDTIQHINYNIDLTFYETAMCHAMLSEYYNISHTDILLLKEHPKMLHDLANIFIRQNTKTETLSS